MTLKEIRGDTINVYADEEALPQSRWSKLIGCVTGTVVSAANRGLLLSHDQHVAQINMSSM